MHGFLWISLRLRNEFEVFPLPSFPFTWYSEGYSRIHCNTEHFIRMYGIPALNPVFKWQPYFCDNTITCSVWMTKNIMWHRNTPLLAIHTAIESDTAFCLLCDNKTSAFQLLNAKPYNPVQRLGQHGSFQIVLYLLIPSNLNIAPFSISSMIVNNSCKIATSTNVRPTNASKYP